MQPTEPTSSPASPAYQPSAQALPDAERHDLPGEPTLPSGQGSRRSLFRGRFGLRAGYGVLIFIAVFLVVATFASLLAVASTGHLREVMNARLYAQQHPGAPRMQVSIPFTARLVTVEDGLLFLSLLLTCFLFAKGEKRRLDAYGLGRNRVADIVPGAAVGVLMLSALVAVLRGLHLLVFDQQNVAGSAAVVSGLKWLLAFLCVGLAEEYEFRGYLQYTLMRGVWGFAERLSATNARTVAFWIAATVWSVVFGALHLGNAGENPFGILAVFLAGMTLSYTLWRTGSLWWGIGWHMAWDWAQSFLFGVADSGNVSVGRLFVTHPAGRPLLSGGSDGPEGSIFVIAALLLTVVVCRLTTRPGLQPSLEREDLKTLAVVAKA